METTKEVGEDIFETSQDDTTFASHINQVAVEAGDNGSL
jgi:hypothetical protein